MKAFIFVFSIFMVTCVHIYAFCMSGLRVPSYIVKSVTSTPASFTLVLLGSLSLFYMLETSQRLLRGENCTWKGFFALFLFLVVWTSLELLFYFAFE